MRFAIKTRPEHQTWEEIRDAWLAADEIPLFESAWNWDHFYPLTGDLTGPNFEAWTMLAAMAQATRRIRIGCQVTGMVYRHPAVLANMAATVDIISGGRLELGLGAAWNQMECDAYGIDLPPLRERFDRFDEGVEAIVRLLSQTTTTFAGQYVRLTEARCEPKPVQRPHPPVTIGGRGCFALCFGYRLASGEALVQGAAGAGHQGRHAEFGQHVRGRLHLGGTANRVLAGAVGDPLHGGGVGCG